MYTKDFANNYDTLGWGNFSEKVYMDIRAHVKNKKNILDIACGTGVLANKLAADGHNVWGFDLSDDMIRVAKRKTSTAVFSVNNMNTFQMKKEFDAITCVYDSINHITNWKHFFKNVAKHLTQDGVFIFDYNTIAGLKKWGNPFIQETKDTICSFSGSYNNKKHSAKLNLKCYKKQHSNELTTLVEDSFTSYTYTKREVMWWLKNAGLTTKKLYPNKHNPYRETLICTKK